MGGLLSGRYWLQSTQSTTSDYCALDIRKINREGMLKPDSFFTYTWTLNDKKRSAISILSKPNYLILAYKTKLPRSEEWKNEQCLVHLDWTPCNYGKQRVWFLCPVHDCGKRVAILYNGTTFSCRKCMQLAYMSQREAKYDRLTRRANKIRKRLQWMPGTIHGQGLKPKGMHLKTFDKLSFEHMIAVDKSMILFMQHIEMFEKHFKKFVGDSVSFKDMYSFL